MAPRSQGKGIHKADFGMKNIFHICAINEVFNASNIEVVGMCWRVNRNSIGPV